MPTPGYGNHRWVYTDNLATKKTRAYRYETRQKISSRRVPSLRGPFRNGFLIEPRRFRDLTTFGPVRALRSNFDGVNQTMAALRDQLLASVAGIG